MGVRLGVFAWPNPEEPRLNRMMAPCLRQGTVMAMLIAWKEFGRVRDGDFFTIAYVVARIRKHAKDPWASIDNVQQSLPAKWLDS